MSEMYSPTEVRNLKVAELVNGPLRLVGRLYEHAYRVTLANSTKDLLWPRPSISFSLSLKRPN